MCAVVRLRALMARQAARLITNPPINIYDGCNIVLKHIMIFATLYVNRGE
jgi:hypothetical protein